MPAPFNSQPQK